MGTRTKGTCPLLFTERRKMLWKNLARRATPAAITAAYDSLGLARNARAEELSPEQLFTLYGALRS
jgi:16S rRNA A1518/A1519 N6-dimethyltransferase RsmA/KsgA/DIM1 with predicted DNA glycosylase/AP lyase activity